MSKINVNVVDDNKQRKQKIHREDPIRRNLISKVSNTNGKSAQTESKKTKRIAKSHITSGFASEKLGAKATFSQVVLRRSTKNEKAGVPFFAFVVETASGIKYLPVRRGRQSVVTEVEKGDIASISSGHKKIKKIAV